MGIGWSYDFEPCKDMEECLSKARQNKSEDMLVSCARDEVDLDARGSGTGPYYCQISFYEDEPTVVYECPESMDWDELVDVMDRFARGEDFSYVRKKWKFVREIDPMSMEELQEALSASRYGVGLEYVSRVFGVIAVMVLAFLLILSMRELF